MSFWAKRDSVFTFKGKDYAFGDRLPAGVPEETLESLKKKKRITKEAPAAKSAGRPEPNDRKLVAAQEGLKEMQGKLDAAEEGLAKLSEINEDLMAQRDAAESISTELKTRLDAAEEKLGDSEKTITELTNQITKPAKK